jgi:hypothetical protein
MKKPEGPINQHKALAMGAPLQECDTSDKGGGFDRKPTSVPGKVHKSGTSTGKR